ncbi:LLM class flavin-dependent oxidoreductase [Actinocrispum wychmicini]|uniref:Putative F420-dependent oxidoreductase n=1 Tax=Actinocrispum wychmicini TaxID=1213861 RepID=A0A4R2J5D7_9PSEU|nr:LLM class flavin-dependent oxidoreductase [Actinocrispum wychmicini]TCO52582.1 putative F420-dependent oxidoreductase [Actinocrispum wychmicini]
MRFGISLPQAGLAPEAFRNYVTRAEELGFDSAWTQEQVLGSKPHLSPLEVMTYAAAYTTRLRLGCSVFVSSLHSPAHLAKSISTVDQLSQGRVEVGFGVGGRTRMLSAFGVSPDGLVSRFTEGVRLMKECWTAPKIDFDGRFWQVHGTQMEPKPVQKPYPPIWFGGGHPNAVRRAVQYADGFFGAGLSTTEDFAAQVKVLREELRGREFPIAKRVYVTVDDDPDRARQTMSDSLDDQYGLLGSQGKLLPIAVTGTPEDCVRGVRAVVAAGAELVLLSPLRNEHEQMERLAAEVIPNI